ncbi:MAG: hypothetical protein QGG14_00820 [Planctomycetota bacterium]|jgi:hypothetical protein|nr:hypothetical protein [Planctomycetota bacterium]
MKARIVEALIISALVAVATFVTNALTSSASKADVVDALKAHGQHPHEGASAGLRAVEAVNAAQDAKLAKLETVDADVRGIRARIDMLLLREVDRPRGRARMRKAAAKVRTSARERGEAGDPLAGLDGL